jgi:hypothetical protein
MNLLQRTLHRRLFRIGLVVFLVGSGPLLLTIAASRLGLTKDPDPNPVMFGILAMFTFWPSVLMMAIAIWKSWRDGNVGPP